MGLTVELRPDVESRLAAEAQLHGKSLGELVAGILEQHVEDQEVEPLTGAEGVAFLRDWVGSFPKPHGTITVEQVLADEDLPPANESWRS